MKKILIFLLLIHLNTFGVTYNTDSIPQQFGIKKLNKELLVLGKTIPYAVPVLDSSKLNDIKKFRIPQERQRELIKLSTILGIIADVAFLGIFVVIIISINLPILVVITVFSSLIGLLTAMMGSYKSPYKKSAKRAFLLNLLPWIISGILGVTISGIIYNLCRNGCE